MNSVWAWVKGVMIGKNYHRREGVREGGKGVRGGGTVFFCSFNIIN